MEKAIKNKIELEKQIADQEDKQRSYKGGRKVLARRRSKGRKVLSAQQATYVAFYFMKKEYRIKKNEEFSKIIGLNKYFSNSLYKMYYSPKNEDNSRIMAISMRIKYS